MKRDLNFNIGGIIFHIEEEACNQLRELLDSINYYYSDSKDSAEIIADIETRIAEIFLLKLGEGKQFIALEDVESLTNYIPMHQMHLV